MIIRLKMLRYTICMVLFLSWSVAPVPINNTSILQSTYARVAKWSTVKNETTPKLVVEGRSNGQSLYAQRSDANIRQVKPKDVVYHYSMKANTRVGEDVHEKLPSKGEVIQERFNPRPYFDYASEEKHHHEPPPTAIVYPSSYQSSKEVDAPPSLDSYNSQISSYNRPPSGIPEEVKAALPAKNKPPISSNFYTNTGYTYNPPNDKPSKNPPFPSYVYDNPKPAPPMAPPPAPPQFPGPYAPPDNEDEKHNDYPNSEEQGPPIEQTVDGPADDAYDFDQHHSEEHQHDNAHMHDSAGNGADLSPPPSGADSGGFPKHIPEYLDHDPTGHYPYDTPHSFDEHHHHHEVYHEVKPTTEAPEDERVNKGHYSYYYLGRKLYYVPLYFSVYFIIYITILILKSIAKHKVNFAHDVHDKFKARSLDSGTEDFNELTANVTDSIYDTRRRFIAM